MNMGWWEMWLSMKSYLAGSYQSLNISVNGTYFEKSLSGPWFLSRFSIKRNIKSLAALIQNLSVQVYLSVDDS